MNQPYLSYLLRLWQTADLEKTAWFASLEEPHTHQMVYFQNLTALWTYLCEITGSEGQQAPEIDKVIKYRRQT